MATKGSNQAPRCTFCGTRSKLYCRGSTGPANIGLCHWARMMGALRGARHEMETGRYVDRALRGLEVINKALETYENENYDDRIT